MADDPRTVRSLAVTVGDVVAAYETRRRSSRRPVLRVTPPFSGRMRARLHDPGPADESEADDRNPETGALHVPPARFVAEADVPAYPTPDATEDALRADPDAEFSVERHRERHVEAVEAWRAAVGESIAASVVLRVGDGTHRVEVKTLDGPSVG
ncbi:hypothetical protein [Halorussus caseinilyticus]|uniref:DUF8009 domain-containing protein n=1 Tax=Halorussus caseinilyticus TaxID=3034025 RepID=A0ABD5WJ09_9EURY|nr:hypothetical protein [Halorussus sp. DT72]